MKKIFFAFCTMALCLFSTSCGSDGCNITGSWAVSDVKLESTKFSESMLGMMETEYLNSIYMFNQDGTMAIIGSSSEPTPGTYTFDALSNQLHWKDDIAGVENILQVNNCSNDSLQLVQRMPADPSQEMTVQVTMTLVQKK